MTNEHKNEDEALTCSTQHSSPTSLEDTLTNEQDDHPDLKRYCNKPAACNHKIRYKGRDYCPY